MPIPSVYVARFFQLVTARQFAEAERVLQRLRQKIQTTEWNRGYFQALYGMLLAQRNNDDRYAFLSNTNLSDKKELQSHRREFLKEARSRVHADYDRGYFSAWADYTRILSKLDLNVGTAPKKNQVHKEVMAEEGVEERKVVEQETKEATREETKTVEKKSTEPKKVEVNEKAERAELRQSTLFDFSK